MKKVVYIVSGIWRSVAFEWIADHLDKERFSLEFVVLSKSPEVPIKERLEAKGIRVFHIPFRGKSIEYPKVIIQLLHLLKRIEPDILHTHLLDAALTGLMTGRLLGLKKRINTRHHATYHHQYARKGILKDKAVNFLATDLIAISPNVRKVLIQKEKVNPGKITYIPHGFDLTAFNEVDRQRVEVLKEKYNIRDAYPVIGVISKYVELKGIQYIIPAFRKLQEIHPNSVLVLANAKGPYRSQIKKELQHLPGESYREITFEEDIFALYQLFTVFVHVPTDPSIEAFGQTYIEALAAGIPSVFTLSGIAPEFIRHRNNALVVEPRSSDAIYEAIIAYLSDEEFKNRITEAGKRALAPFGLNPMINKLEKLYGK